MPNWSFTEGPSRQNQISWPNLAGFVKNSYDKITKSGNFHWRSEWRLTRRKTRWIRRLSIAKLIWRRWSTIRSNSPSTIWIRGTKRFWEIKRFMEEKTFLGFSSKHIFKQVDTFRVSKNKVTAAASRQLKWFENEIDTNVSFDISLWIGGKNVFVPH